MPGGEHCHIFMLVAPFAHHHPRSILAQIVSPRTSSLVLRNSTSKVAHNFNVRVRFVKSFDGLCQTGTDLFGSDIQTILRYKNELCNALVSSDISRHPRVGVRSAKLDAVHTAYLSKQLCTTHMRTNMFHNVWTVLARTTWPVRAAVIQYSSRQASAQNLYADP